MSVKTEYRLVWQREGLRRKSRRFQSLAAAERHIVRLTTGDPHYQCDHDLGRCEPCPPVIEGPTIQQREVTPWQVTP